MKWNELTSLMFRNLKANSNNGFPASKVFPRFGGSSSVGNDKMNPGIGPLKGLLVVCSPTKEQRNLKADFNNGDIYIYIYCCLRWVGNGKWNEPRKLVPSKQTTSWMVYSWQVVCFWLCGSSSLQDHTKGWEDDDNPEP